MPKRDCLPIDTAAIETRFVEVPELFRDGFCYISGLFLGKTTSCKLDVVLEGTRFSALT